MLCIGMRYSRYLYKHLSPVGHVKANMFECAKSYGPVWANLSILNEMKHH